MADEWEYLIFKLWTMPHGTNAKRTIGQAGNRYKSKLSHIPTIRKYRRVQLTPNRDGIK